MIIIPVDNITISLTANDNPNGVTIDSGQCATIRWDVENVQGVYFEGQGVPGHDSIQVCPASTQTYSLLVNKTDGSRVEQQVTVTVNQNAGVPAVTTTGQLNWNLQPLHGTHSLQAGFVIDPYTIDFPLQDGVVNLGQTLGCAGFVNSGPDISLHYTAGDYRLRFFAKANEHTVLVINDPNGQWYCADQYYPIIDVTNPLSGRYDIWVGRNANQGHVYNVTGSYVTLTITETNLTP